MVYIDIEVIIFLISGAAGLKIKVLERRISNSCCDSRDSYY